MERGKRKSVGWAQSSWRPRLVWWVMRAHPLGEVEWAWGVRRELVLSWGRGWSWRQPT